MKTKLLILLVSALTFVFACSQTNTSANEETTEQTIKTLVDNDTSEVVLSTSFKVFGSCGMCKKRIEKAASKVDGVTSAVWDQETQMLKVTYGESFDLTPVYKAVAAAGHDTEADKAPDKVYNALPGCCKYRK